ncbi:MAG: hypothetical protein A4E60_01955 [Syntrophorhabdus sp. PtaB.Bin047]|nr:MAG: hypothetical protein A4E60_01955 [Syntrophorhabdus sp. PtaB.Bin047]
MKKDIAAVVAVGVAILVMVVCVILGFAGPARADQDLLATAEIKCQEALGALENRAWGQVIEQLTVPGETRASLSLSVMPVPAGQVPRAVKPKDVSLVHAFRAGGDTVIFENMNGSGRCTVTAHNAIERDGKLVPEWTVEAVSLAGVGEVRRAPDVIVRK